MKEKGQKFISEAGAIMLEVIAVLSLMGLMGTMLFRQIYLRNQELHNIQMASEIRVVKEAFAAWIQANSTTLESVCAAPADPTETNFCAVTDAALQGIADFMPDGYFSDSEGTAANVEIVSDSYSLYLISYFRGADNNILTYYGVVVPTETVLPDPSEWNFKRAARVAMLIGIDGGAYDNSITGRDIAGAVGTWTIPAEDLCLDADCDIPFYVAITAIDVFQPEVTLPNLKLKFPDDWDLALRDATVYGAFTAGGAANCYTLGREAMSLVWDVDNGGDTVTLDSDEVEAPSGTCWPAFYVESGADGDGKATGNVRVANDLSVGYNYTSGKAAMRFDKDGMIVFENAAVKDPQTGKDINYVLDPKYTSVMNDIKIMSRGGAKLSDILPNYILKTSQEGNCTLPAETHCPAAGCFCSGGTFNKPDCPQGYKKALVVIPRDLAGAYRQRGDVFDALHGSTTTSFRGISDVNVFRPFVEVEDTSDSSPWTVKLGFKTAIISTEWSDPKWQADMEKLYYDIDLHAVIQTYCVFDDGTGFDWNGSDVDGLGSAPEKERACDKITDQGLCEQHGCTWTEATGECSGGSVW